MLQGMTKFWLIMLHLYLKLIDKGAMLRAEYKD